jgi:hypothetical protein
VRGVPVELAAREREGRVQPKSETERGMRERDVLLRVGEREGIGECESLRGRIKSKGLGNIGWWVGSMGKGSRLMA